MSNASFFFSSSKICNVFYVFKEASMSFLLSEAKHMLLVSENASWEYRCISDTGKKVLK